jgi:hypothetical protein
MKSAASAKEYGRGGVLAASTKIIGNQGVMAQDSTTNISITKNGNRAPIEKNTRSLTRRNDMPRIKLTANGKAVSVDVEHRTLLVRLLRDHPQSVSG